MCSLALDNLSIGCDELARHHPEAPKSLSKDVALHIPIVVLAGPHEPT